MSGIPLVHGPPLNPARLLSHSHTHRDKGILPILLAANESTLDDRLLAAAPIDLTYLSSSSEPTYGAASVASMNYPGPRAGMMRATTAPVPSSSFSSRPGRSGTALASQHPQECFVPQSANASSPHQHLPTLLTCAHPNPIGQHIRASLTHLTSPRKTPLHQHPPNLLI